MKPRPQEKNELVLISRHALEQRPSLRPSKVFNDLVGYCLGLALSRTGVELNVATINLDRALLGSFDVECERSSFMRDFFGFLARALNRRHDRSGAPIFGPRDNDGATPLLDRESALETMAEVLAAPVELDLVERVEEWPGLRFGPEDWGKTFAYERPADFFSDAMPERVAITPVPPPGFEEMGTEALAEEVKRRVEARELAAKLRREARGVEVMGLKAMRRLKPRHIPKRPAPRTARAHFRASTEALSLRALAFVRRFWADHRAAKKKMLQRGPERDYAFPQATYWWRKWSDAPCKPRRERQPFDPP